MPTQSTAAPTSLNRPNAARAVAAICLFILMYAAGAAPLAETLAPGVPHYFDHFDPEQRPWKPGQYLNIEEVFKNYQYYEVVVDQNGRGITVNQYIRGSKAGSEKYLILPDGSLQKDEQ